MLTPDHYAAWVRRLRLSSEAERVVTSVRTGSPVRQVTSRIGNVSGTYSSRKMDGRRIQFESHQGELWTIYLLEHDPEVLEYFDQPNRIKLTYTSAKGRQTSPWHTPDFFVLRERDAGWVECKPEQTLFRLSEQMPYRYQRDGQGKWRCPPGEVYAEALGLSYRVVSSASASPILIQNLRFLHDYWTAEVPVNPELRDRVKAHVHDQPGIRLADLREVASLDLLYTLIATEVVWTDLSASVITRHADVHLYPDASFAPSLPLSVPSSALPNGMGYVSFAWDGRVWIATTWGKDVTIQPEFGPAIILPMAQVKRLMREGHLSVFKSSDSDPTSPETRRCLSHASPQNLERANHRYQTLLSWLGGERVTESRKTLARWRGSFAAAEVQYGCGYVGLLDREHQRGPQASFSAPDSLALVDEAITHWYATPTAPTQKSVYVRYVHLCEERGVEPVSVRTMYRAIKAREGAEMTTARKGRRAGYQEQSFYWHLEQATPRHGERPWAVAHLDHTQCDLEVVSSVTGKPLGRPWATFLVDAYSRRLLAVTVTLDPPSYRSCLMSIRQCVQRFERLPQDLVIDGGKDFQSVYFETLLSRYEVTRKNRPGSRPRFGSVVERLFGTTTTQFINTLAGNTQASKIPRQMTREVNPKERAVWTLATFAERLKMWAFTVYDESPHPALQASPREMYDMGMHLSGDRAHKRIAYAEDFLMMTRPSTHTGKAKVQRGTGVTIKYLQYWSDAFKIPGVVGSQVPVRYEPFDLGVAWAYVSGQWVTCFANRYQEVHGRSEREWDIAVTEWRHDMRVMGKEKVRADGQRLAKFLAENEAREVILAQRMRDLEAQGIEDGRVPVVAAPLHETPNLSHTRFTLDLADLPIFEEDE